MPQDFANIPEVDTGNESPAFRPGPRSPLCNELFAAISKAQGEIEGAKKDSTNPHFKSSYADLASVRDVTREPLAKNGLAILQWPRTTEGGVEIETILTHQSGQYMSGVLWLPCGKFDAQGIGSAITYGRRYALMAVTGVAPVDDDGNAAVESGGGKRPPSPPLQPRQSSENGRRMAADDPHLIDQSRPKGVMANGNGDALRLEPHEQPRKRLSAAEQKAKDWTDQAVGTLNLSEQSKDSLATFWRDNKEKIGWMEANAATEYERLLNAYDQAVERAAARAA